MNPFFTVETHEPDEGPVPPWTSMSELVDDPAVLAGRVDQVRSYLAAGTNDVELRVAASVTQLGLAARLISPVLARAIDHKPLMVELADLWWQRDTISSLFPLSLPETKQPAVDDAAALASLIDTTLTPLCDAVTTYGVNQHIAWGNVASAFNGAARMLSQAHPEHQNRTRKILRALVDHPRLAGQATLNTDGTFRRRDCCLIYRAAPDRAGPLCGDCGLTHPPVRRSPAES